jgi:hypothetical protein
MEIGGEGIENFHMNMVLKKNNSKDTFPCIFTWEWVEQIPIWNSPSDDLWSVKSSYPNQHKFIGIYMNQKSYILMLQNGAMPKTTLSLNCPKKLSNCFQLPLYWNVIDVMFA